MIISTYVENSEMGFGDFLKGSIHLYKICKKYKIKFDIDLKYHPISKYFINCKKNIYQENDVKIFYNIGYKTHDFFFKNFNDLIHEIINNKNNKYYICSNIFPKTKKPLMKNEKNIMKKLLKLKRKLISFNNKKFLKDYNIIHIRFLDNNINEYNLKKFKNISRKILRNINKKYRHILISNNIYFKKYMKKYKFLKIIKNTPGHLGKINDKNKIYSTILDYFLIINSKKIYTYSEYSWISGFVNYSSKIYSIKIINLKKK
jgi:hypothetical protein